MIHSYLLLHIFISVFGLAKPLELTGSLEMERLAHSFVSGLVEH